MRYLYLDQNVYIEALENMVLRERIKSLPSKDIQCVYSPAHIEEIYKVEANDKSQYRDKMKGLMAIISEATNNMEILPTASELIIKKEHPSRCYSRVKGIDTRERVEQDSKIKFEVDTANYKRSLNADKHNSSISNIEPEKIWEFPSVKAVIDDFNEKREVIINNYNNSLEVQLLALINIDKRLPDSFRLQQGNFAMLKSSHKQLEYTIEILFRILNFSGYYAEKSEKTTISGTHDISHSIYGTKADCFLSTDRRFAKKCQAVYHFLGVNIPIVYCKQDEIVDKIDKL